MLANLFLIPVAEKLRSRTDEEILQIQIITEGILMIQSGTNPRIIEQKLNSFLPPYMRTSYYREMLKRHKELAER
jgi:chemotaxis protein MotA